MREKISVCMAAYNGEKRIGRQLQSVMNQLEADDEVIIVDDCSTDGTREYISKFACPAIRYFRHEKNQGYVKSFEDAIAHAKHDIVFLCDQDDEWMREKVEKVIPFFENPRIGLVIHNAEVVSADGQRIKEKLFERGLGTCFINRHLFNAHNYGCVMAFRKSKLKFLLPFPSIVESHDQWVAINADMNKCEVLFMDENLIKWIRYGDNTTDVESKKRSLWDKILTRLKQVCLVIICIYRKNVKIS